MSDDKANQIPATFLDVVKNTLDGGVLRLIASKPVQEAIGRLVAGLTDIPAAYLESISRNIRRETESKDTVYAAIAAAAASTAANDDGIVLRGVERWARQLEAKQKSRETVAIRTLEVLSEDESLENAEAPNEDFMRMFEDIVEKVSSEQLTDLMARILAGEIRKPGSVSRRTLQTVAILDQQIVQALIDLQPYMLDGFWWIVPSKKRQEWYGLFDLLSSVSITNAYGTRTVNPNQHGKAALKMGKRAILIDFKDDKFVPFVDGVNLTPIGIELVSVLPLSANHKIDEIAAGLKEDDWWKGVEVIDL